MIVSADSFSAAFNAAERRRRRSAAAPAEEITNQTETAASPIGGGLGGGGVSSAASGRIGRAPAVSARTPVYADPLTEMARADAARANAARAASRRDSHDVYHTIKAAAAPEFSHGSGSFGRGAEKQSYGAFLKSIPSLIGEGVQARARASAAMATDDVIDPLEAAAFGAYKPALSVGEALARSFDRDFGNAESHRRMDEFGRALDETQRKAKAEHPIAYGVGGAVGTIPLTYGLGSAVNAIPGVEALSTITRGAVTGGAVMSAKRFADDIGAAAAGRTDAGDFARSMLADGLGGALGGGAAAALGEVLSGKLRRLRMKDFVNPDSPVGTMWHTTM